MVFNLQQCPLRKNITLQATQPCKGEHGRAGSRLGPGETSIETSLEKPDCGLNQTDTDGLTYRRPERASN